MTTKYAYKIQYDNGRKTRKKYNIIASSIEELYTICFNKFGSNYLTYCKLLSVKPIDTSKK